VLQTLATDTLLSDHYRLDCVATLVDAVNGMLQLDTQPEAVKQAAVADRLLLTKTDLAAPEQVDALKARLRALNPHAVFTVATHGEVDPALLTDVGLRNARPDAARVDRWLGETGDGSGYLGQRLAPGVKHDAAIKSFALVFEQPFPWDTFSAALDLVSRLRGPDLLRVKGLVNVAGEKGPVVVQGVQHVFHPTVTLDAWPSDDRRTRLVFITRDIPRETIEQLFAAVGALKS
jgi:G3E family GTPase